MTRRYKLISTEKTRADNFHEGAERLGGLHTGYHGVQERQPDSSTSSPRVRGKGKSKDEDDDKTGNPENKENTAVTDRQNNVLNESKSELQATELLKKVQELQKEVDDIAKMLSESGISLPTGREQAHGRSGVDSAGKTSNGQTGKPSPSGGSGSRGEPTHVRYRGMHEGNHRVRMCGVWERAGIWGHAPGYGSHSSRP